MKKLIKKITILLLTFSLCIPFAIPVLATSSGPISAVSKMNLYWPLGTGTYSVHNTVNATFDEWYIDTPHE